MNSTEKERLHIPQGIKASSPMELRWSAEFHSTPSDPKATGPLSPSEALRLTELERMLQTISTELAQYRHQVNKLQLIIFELEDKRTLLSNELFDLQKRTIPVEKLRSKGKGSSRKPKRNALGLSVKEAQRMLRYIRELKEKGAQR